MKKYKDLDRVLLVDDEMSTNFLHRKIVQTSNIDVDVKAISSAFEALEYLKFMYEGEEPEAEIKPGIIFLDINMPGMNGWEFMKEYKKLDLYKRAKIVVIMLTTSLNPDDEELAAKDNEIVTFMHKPLTRDSFSKIANKYFELDSEV
jgi:CheY-like chemotaxis protein